MTFDLNDTTFVCIDISPRERDRVWTWEKPLLGWVESDFTPEELNAAEARFHDTMLPNALKTAEFARERGLPMAFVHWADNVDGGFAGADLVFGLQWGRMIGVGSFSLV